MQELLDIPDCLDRRNGKRGFDRASLRRATPLPKVTVDFKAVQMRGAAKRTAARHAEHVAQKRAMRRFKAKFGASTKLCSDHDAWFADMLAEERLRAWQEGISETFVEELDMTKPATVKTGTRLRDKAGQDWVVHGVTQKERPCLVVRQNLDKPSGAIRAIWLDAMLKAIEAGRWTVIDAETGEPTETESDDDSSEPATEAA